MSVDLWAGTRAWLNRGGCARPDAPPGLWTSDNVVAQVTARHICRVHCPVLELCVQKAQRAIARGDIETSSPLVVGGSILSPHAHQTGGVSNPKKGWAECWICRGTSPPATPEDLEPAKRTTIFNHGTIQGFNWHNRNKVPFCDPCREARRIWRRNRSYARHSL